MIKIGLLSDTHSWLDPKLLAHFANCAEIWHAGDIGNIEVLETLEASGKKIRAVYGNIDGGKLRQELPLDARFEAEGLDVWITHIGGYPGRYQKRIREALRENPPGLFICGHSHILKVMYDHKHQLLHINPGACGQHGFHKIRTAVRFDIESGEIKNLEIIELGKRGQLQEGQIVK
ncbi:MAG: metallophosphoesterase family protein [Bacteroidetes bacterium]|nr:metallophosphoesterase family protein [Bacteroidota bacterium]